MKNILLFCLLTITITISFTGKAFAAERNQLVCDTKYPETQYDVRIDYCVCPTVEQKTWNKYTYCGFANGAIRIDNIYNYVPRGPKVTADATYGWAVKKKKSIPKKQQPNTTSIFETRTKSSEQVEDRITNILYLCKNGEWTLMDPDRMSDDEKRSTAKKSTEHNPDLVYNEGDVVVYGSSLRKIRPPQNCNSEKKYDIRYDIYQCTSSNNKRSNVKKNSSTKEGQRYIDDFMTVTYGLNDKVYVLNNEKEPLEGSCSILDVYQCTSGGWYLKYKNQKDLTSLPHTIESYGRSKTYNINERVYLLGPNSSINKENCVSQYVNYDIYECSNKNTWTKLKTIERQEGEDYMKKTGNINIGDRVFIIQGAKDIEGISCKENRYTIKNMNVQKMEGNNYKITRNPMSTTIDIQLSIRNADVDLPYTKISKTNGSKGETKIALSSEGIYILKLSIIDENNLELEKYSQYITYRIY